MSEFERDYRELEQGVGSISQIIKYCLHRYGYKHDTSVRSMAIALAAYVAHFCRNDEADRFSEEYRK